MNEKTALAGQAALITGASSGLGRATALALARVGASVALVARSASDLADVAQELRGNGVRALPVACDLADAEALAGAVRRTRDELGPVRVLVNAAATDVPGAVSELTVEAWDRVLSVNLRAAFLLSRLALPDMIQAGQGTIVNVSSVAGKRGWANASPTARPSSPSRALRRRSVPRSGRTACARASSIPGPWRPIGVPGPPRTDLGRARRGVRARRCPRTPSLRSSPGLRRRHRNWCWTKRSSRHWTSTDIRRFVLRRPGPTATPVEAAL
jgi:short chain dehydrogenase